MDLTPQPSPQFKTVGHDSQNIQLVWLKRDLRLADHAPLAQAAKNGPLLALAVIESDYWSLPESSCRHYLFWRDSLAELQAQGLPITVITGDVVSALSALKKQVNFTAIWSHEETGNAWTYQRDKVVKNWAKRNAVPWIELAQFGVFRGGVNRDGWAKRWEAQMAQPQVFLPEQSTWIDVGESELPSPVGIGLLDDGCTQRQKGGRAHALALLDSFLYGARSRNYCRAMSNPLEGAHACSRLSPHIAYGTVSIRELVQRAYLERKKIIADVPDRAAIPVKSLDAFVARLHWHCHFIQKLESEPEIEVRDLHPAFRGARTKGVDDPAYLAFAEGQTGFPFIDACMRSLIATGWINFRMRAMLTAFASYHLWLDWRASGTRLAQLFTDYEPGIHWPQTQMQSGSTAINTPRIYNPIKQSHDQDPDGIFIKRWVPELRALDGRAVHEPWTLSPLEAASLGFKIGQSYPQPIIDHEVAARAARERLTRIRNAPGFYGHQKAIYQKHGSRKSSRHTPAQGRPWANKRKASADQLELDL